MLDILGKLVGSGIDFYNASENREAQERQAELNRQMQKEFAQQGIRWKVEDAKAAGVHPLFALGASSHSYSPVSVGSTQMPSMASALGSMGQSVDRAINATSTGSERVSAYSEQAAKLQLDNMALQNQLLASRLARVNQAGGNPPLPEAGGLPPIPQDTKQDARPPLQMGGDQISTDPGTSNMQKFEDRYGDEGPVPWTLQIGVAYHDLVRNYGSPATWPTQIMHQAWSRLSTEAREEYGNFQRFTNRLRSLRPSVGSMGGGGW